MPHGIVLMGTELTHKSEPIIENIVALFKSSNQTHVYYCKMLSHVTSESDLRPLMMVLGGNKTLELNEQRTGSASSSEVRSPSNTQCLIDA